MSGRLDQSLDDIVMKDGNNTRRNNRRAPRKAETKTKVAVAPTGGIMKNSTRGAKAKGAKGVVASKAVIPISSNGESKIMVGGLPIDIGETQIKDYFVKTIGPVKRVHLTYGPTGQSRGVSTIIFSKPDAALRAANELNGVKVDGRSLRVEVILSAADAPIPVPPKALAERMAKSSKQQKSTKNQPKSATPKTNSSNTERGAARGGRKPNAGRPKRKTAAELDAEMTDYFVDGTAANGNGSAATNGAAQTAEAGSMEAEIMASHLSSAI